jgi:antitoxin component YwqK of YwqJK toxin-antitoxin module
MYTGPFKYGAMHGLKGTYTSSSGTSYKGRFKNNQKHGRGEEVFKSGQRYLGRFEKGQPEGFGVQYNPSGSVFHLGQWRKGMPISCLDGQEVAADTYLSPLPREDCDDESISLATSDDGEVSIYDASFSVQSLGALLSTSQPSLRPSVITTRRQRSSRSMKARGRSSRSNGQRRSKEVLLASDVPREYFLKMLSLLSEQHQSMTQLEVVPVAADISGKEGTITMRKKPSFDHSKEAGTVSIYDSNEGSL